MLDRLFPFEIRSYILKIISSRFSEAVPPTSTPTAQFHLCTMLPNLNVRLPLVSDNEADSLRRMVEILAVFGDSYPSNLSSHSPSAQTILPQQSGGFDSPGRDWSRDECSVPLSPLLLYTIRQSKTQLLQQVTNLVNLQERRDDGAITDASTLFAGITQLVASTLENIRSTDYWSVSLLRRIFRPVKRFCL